MGLTVERWRRQKWTHKHKHGHNMPEGIPMWEEHGPCSLHKTAFVLSYQANRYCIKWAAKTCYWQQKTHIICVHKHKKKHTLSHLLSEPYHKILTPLITTSLRHTPQDDHHKTKTQSLRNKSFSLIQIHPAVLSKQPKDVWRLCFGLKLQFVIVT